MEKFFKKFLLFCLAFIVFDRLFFLFLWISPSLEIDKRLERVLNGEMNKDIVVLGSSLGARNIIASQIEDSLHLSAYNLSYPGSDVTFHEFLLKTLVKFNAPPKVLLLTVDDPTELLPNEAIKFRFDRLYPLVKYNYITQEMIDRGEKNFLSKFLILSRINKANFDVRKKGFTALDTIQECGSMPIAFQRQDKGFEFDSISHLYAVDDEVPEKVAAFLSIQEICRKNQIQLVLVFSPNFKKFNTHFHKRLIELSSHQVKCIVYDTLNPIYLEKSSYYDQTHLQKCGAEVFTGEVVDKFRSLNANLLRQELKEY